VAVTIRPPDPADLAPLTGFLGGLSTRTLVQRFFAPVRPTPALVRRACGQASPAGHADVLLATHGSVIIGHAMAADRAAAADRADLGDRAAPGDPTAAASRAGSGESVTEIGVVVADAWQGQGVGSALVRTLLRRAQARGVTSLCMDVLPDNNQVLAMIAGHWTAARTRRDADCVTIEVGLPAARPEPVTPSRVPLAAG
jgi:GNAT superfamily N-acetyltransferase